MRPLLFFTWIVDQSSSFLFFYLFGLFYMQPMILPIEYLNLEELFMNESYSLFYLSIYTCVTCSLLLLLIKTASRWRSKAFSSL